MKMKCPANIDGQTIESIVDENFLSLFLVPWVVFMLTFFFFNFRCSLSLYLGYTPLALFDSISLVADQKKNEGKKKLSKLSTT